MHNIKVIIGASYGDEGKGLATDFFGAREELREELINVLTNGGPGWPQTCVQALRGRLFQRCGILLCPAVPCQSHGICPRIR